MAKKKTTKKPVSKRVTKTTAPKTRKPRAKKIKQDGMEVTITEGPATQWVSGNADQFLDTADGHIVQQTPSWVSSQEVQTEVKTEVPTEVKTSGSVFIANYPDQRVEFTKVNKSGWAEAASDSYDDFISKMKKSDFTTQIRDFAFAHPLIFGIAFCTGILFVLTVTAIAARIFGW